MTGPALDVVGSYLSKYRQNADVPVPLIPQQTQTNGMPQLAFRNNNPGNLGYAGQDNAVPGDKGFAKFDSASQGYTALLDQIRLDQNRGLNLGSFIAKYAPPAQNDTTLYVAQMSKRLGASPLTPIAHLDVEELARAIAQKESGTQVIDAAHNPMLQQLQQTLAPQHRQFGPGAVHHF